MNAKGTSGEVEMPDWFFTPLWRAAHDGRLASIQVLTEGGADLNYATPDGANQALKTSAENGRLDACKYLLSHGAIPDLITAAMLGLADRARALLHAGHDEAAGILIQHGAKMEVAHCASLGRADEVRRAVEDDSDILRRPVEMVALIGGAAVRESPLMAAKRRERDELVEYLQKHGATEQPRVIWR